MADGFVQVQPDSTGKQVDTSEVTVGGVTRERQRVVFADDTNAAGLTSVLNAPPVGTEYGIVTRTIPSETPNLVTGTITLASTAVTLALSGVPSTWAVLVSGTWAGSLRFERSLDGGTTWDTMLGLDPSTHVGISIVTANGEIVGTVGGATNIRVWAVSLTSGTVNVTLRATTAPSGYVVNSLRLMDASGTLSGARIAPGNGTPNVSDTQLVVGVHPNSIVKVNNQATTSGGSLVARRISTASTNAVGVKASAGQIYGWYLYNSNATNTIYFKVFDKASAPTVGVDVPYLTIPIPAGAAANVWFGSGVFCDLGIAFAITGGAADSDNTAIAANDFIVNLFYA